MNKLKRLLAKRGIVVKYDHKLRRRFIKEKKLTRTAVGWYWNKTPNIIYVVRLSFNQTDTILHEYRHWIQLKRKWKLWCADISSEKDADRFAIRARNRF